MQLQFVRIVSMPDGERCFVDATTTLDDGDVAPSAPDRSWRGQPDRT